MTSSKTIYILLGLACAFTAATVAVSLTHRTDATEVALGLLRSAAGVTWCVLAICAIGERIIKEIRKARHDALQQIALLEQKWGDKLGAAELDYRLNRAEDGSGGSISWLQKRGL